MIQPWLKESSRQVGDFRIFSIRSDLKISPRTGDYHDFFVIDTVDWVNVVALTPLREIVMIEQYRHGTNSVELEIPGGMIDPEDKGPVEGGVRELREETGYEGSHPLLIGQVYPNPAIMSNTCSTVLVRNCELKYGLALDDSEDVVTHLVPIDEIPKLVLSGRVKHSLVAVALYHFELWIRDHPLEGQGE